MAQNINILQELNELNSSLSGLALPQVYQVPDGYFEDLASLVINRIKALEATNAGEELSYLSPLLGTISKEMPYVVPAGYFESLEERLIYAVDMESRELSAKEELETLSPLLGGLSRKMPYTVPAGYFDSLNSEANKEVSRPAGKVVSMSSRKWLRYAAAAVVTGVILISGMIIKQNNPDPNKDSHAWVKKNIKKVSTDKLEEFVNLSDEETLVKKSVASSEKSVEVRELLKDVPQSEIDSFLEDADILDESGDDTLMN